MQETINVVDKSNEKKFQMFKAIKKFLNRTLIASLLVTNILTVYNDTVNSLISSAMAGVAAPFVSLIGNSVEAATLRDKQERKVTTLKNANQKLEKRTTALNTKVTELESSLAKAKQNPVPTARQKRKSIEIADRIKQRTLRKTAFTTGELFASAVPGVSVAAAIVDTGLEVQGYCQTFKDMNELYQLFGLEPAIGNDTEVYMCDMKLPSQVTLKPEIKKQVETFSNGLSREWTTIKNFWGEAFERLSD